MRGMASGFNGNARPPGTGVNSPLDAEGRTALHLAVQKNDTAAMDKLLRVNANPNQQDKAGQSPLFAAIEAKNIATVRLLIDKGASFELRDDKKRTALDWAIEKECDVEFIASLKNLGADPNAPALDNRRTAMHLAAEKNRPDLIAYLHSAGLSLNQQDANGATPLHLAVASRAQESLSKLIELRADAAIRNNQIETPLHLAAQTGNIAAASSLLDLPEVRRTVNEHRNYGQGFTPLMSAVAANQTAIIEKIVSVGGNVNATDNQNRNSLFIAVENGHVEAAKLLIRLGSDGAKSEGATYNKSSMVHWINSKNYAEMLLLLHNAGFDLNARDSSGVTPLNKAADQMDKAKMKALLDLGADPNIANDYGRRPLDTIMDNYTYSYSDHKDAIALLLAKGAEVGPSPNINMLQAPLHLAARQGKTDDIKLLLNRGAAIDQPSRGADGMTPLMAALESGKHDSAAVLLAGGADPLKKDSFSRSSIAFAARGGSEKALDALLAVPGVIDHINDVDNRGRTPAHDAFRKYHNDMGVALVKKGASVSVMDKDGLTPLHQAVITSYMSDFMPGLKEALGDKADWNVRTRDGDTPLHLAAKHNQMPVLEKLLEYGADPALQGRGGMIPLHVALMNDNTMIVTKLLEAMKAKQISPDSARDDAGWGALHYAVLKDNSSFTQDLIEAGADVNAKSKEGDTPLHIAARAGKINAVRTLLSNGAEALSPNANAQSPLDIAMAMKRVDIAQALLAAAAEQDAAKAKPAASPFSKWKPFTPGNP